MHAVFLACLVGGTAATALFALLGFGGGGHFEHHAGAHGHHAGPTHAHHGSASHGHHAAGHHAGSHGSAQRLGAGVTWGLSWLSPLTVAAAALWFGGVGLITENTGAAVLFAVLAAIVGAALIRTMMNALLRASTPPLTGTAEGAVGTVNATIRPNAPGEVIYTLEGLHRSLPARSAGNSVIPRGTAVVITRRESGFAWVEPLDPLAELDSPSDTHRYETPDAAMKEESSS